MTRPTLAKTLAILGAVIGLIAVPATAGSAHPAGGVKGDPQPELKPFTLGSATSDSSVATEPGGELLMAWPVGTSNDVGTVTFCALARGADKCAFTTTLTPVGGDVIGVPQVIAVSDTDVDVIMGVGGDGNNLLFQSTDGGHTFGSGVDVGDQSLATSVMAGDDVAYGGTGAASQDSFDVFSLSSPTTVTTITPYSGYERESALSTYEGGLLTAESDGTAAQYQVKVSYNATTANLADPSDYKTIADFKDEEVLAMSGNALLTQQASGKEKVQLRLFNGTSWSAPKTVPNYKNSGPSEWQVAEDSAGQVDVFSDLADATDYHLYLTTTTNGGMSFTKDVDLGDAINGGAFNNSIDSIGAGLVEAGSEDDKVVAYPVLAAAGVSIKVAPQTVKVNKTATVTGSVLPGETGAKVYLQQEVSGRWHTLQTGTLNSSKKYSFNVKSGSPKSLTLRVESDFVPGYLEYGYSAAAGLSIYKPTH